jgi:hypothetical protein
MTRIYPGNLLQSMLSQKPVKHGAQSRCIFCLAFPYGQATPSLGLQCNEIGFIARNIFSQFLIPEIRIGCRSATLTTIMPVPEAAMNENHRLVLWQNNVWFSRQVFTVKPKPKPHAV